MNIGITKAIATQAAKDEIAKGGLVIDNVARTGVQEVKSQLDEKVNIDEFHLYVGANQKYKTIKSAIDEWQNQLTINKRPTVIYLSRGVYKEKISYYGQANLSFIGENKNDVIWKYCTGYYRDAPLTMQGNIYCKGITFIANYEDNPTYTYTPFTATDTSGGAYAVHIDQSGVSGKSTLEDCDLYSYQNSALGSGTRTDQTIELINCNCYQYVNPAWTEPNNNGALLYHTANEVNNNNQNLILNNSKFFSENGYSAKIWGMTGNNVDVSLEIVGCNFYSNLYKAENSVLITGNTTKLKIKDYNYGNNILKLNVVDNMQISILTDNNGNCMNVTDCNNADKTGFYQCNTNTANAPSTVPFYITTISANSQYKIQKAYQMTNINKIYTRVKSAGIWGSWIEDLPPVEVVDSSGNCKQVTDCNNADKTGYYQCNTNTANAPSNVSHYIETYSASSQFKFQYAWQMVDTTKKFRRDMKSGVWGSWITCTE